MFHSVRYPGFHSVLHPMFHSVLHSVLHSMLQSINISINASFRISTSIKLNSKEQEVEHLSAYAPPMIYDTPWKDALGKSSELAV